MVRIKKDTKASYNAARTFARSLKLKSVREWRNFVYRAAKDSFPTSIPKNPKIFYQKEWKGWEDFLGDSYLKKKWVPYSEAKVFARKLQLKSIPQWKEYVQGKRADLPALPLNIPKRPDTIYRYSGFEGWIEFLGSEKRKALRTYRTYDQAKAFVNTLGIKNPKQWREYCKGNLKDLPKLPDDIPAGPDTYYKQEWEGYPEWLRGKRREYASYLEALSFAKQQNIKTKDGWQEAIKKFHKTNPKRNRDFPYNPELVYAANGDWKGWTAFIGKELRIMHLDKPWPYDRAANFVRKLKIKSKRQWFSYIKGEMPHLPEIPKTIPRSPNKVYGKKWKGWTDFLGTKPQLGKDIKKWSFVKARAYIQNLGIKNKADWLLYTKGRLPGYDLKPIQIPSYPRIPYKKEWKGWKDFLGL